MIHALVKLDNSSLFMLQQPWKNLHRELAYRFVTLRDASSEMLKSGRSLESFIYPPKRETFFVKPKS